MSSSIVVMFDTIVNEKNNNNNNTSCRYESCCYSSIVHKSNMSRILLHNDYLDGPSIYNASSSLFQHTIISKTLGFPYSYCLSSFLSSLRNVTNVQFLPDFTEHPKPVIVRPGGKDQHHHHHHPPCQEPPNQTNNGDDNDNSNNNSTDKQGKEQEITFFHDFIAGGVAGSASVIVGHPFDTIKVRMQTSKNVTDGIFTTFTEFGGISSLFRGITAPLYTAALVNAIIFASYGLSSRIYNDLLLDTNSTNNTTNNNNQTSTTTTTITNDNDATAASAVGFEFRYNNHDYENYNDYMDMETTIVTQTHDPWQKAMICGAFAGFMQCFIICPMEHVKCRLQIQHDITTTAGGGGGGNNSVLAMQHKYTSPYQATRSIVQEYGVQRLYQGWWVTCWREVPAFGLYFAIYDYLKDQANVYIASNFKDVVHNNNNVSSIQSSSSTSSEHSHTWLASAFAGGCAGCITWAIVYPLDVIKTHIQTSCLTTPKSQLRMIHVGYTIIQQYGISYLFRGLGITLIRAFPVNGTIFPVYEFTLKQVCHYTDQS